MTEAMLEPQHRKHVLESLRPPPGYEFDCAVGTTYSLDLLALMTVPLAFTLFDMADDEGRSFESQMALLEALRRNARRVSIFYQAGRIAAPRTYRQLLTYVEGSVFEAAARSPHGAFHPKVWVLRFAGGEGQVLYRVLCLSRNLTFDRSWDTVLSLEGALTGRQNAVAASRPLGDFVSSLPRLAPRPLPAHVLEDIELVQREIRRVKFEPPVGFDEIRFWPLGIEGAKRWPFGRHLDRALVVSPFLSGEPLEKLTRGTEGSVLVSNLPALDELGAALPETFESIYFLDPAAEVEEETETGEDGNGRFAQPKGLHAKLYVTESGPEASVWTGSANATGAAFNSNVEFLVELAGRKSLCGVEAFLARDEHRTNFADLLQPYEPDGEKAPSDPLQKELEEAVAAARHFLATSTPVAHVRAAEGVEMYHVSFESPRRGDGEVPPAVSVRCWPISLHESSAVTPEYAVKLRASFGPLSFEALTSFFAFELTARKGQKQLSYRFVLNAPLEGAPADRQERLLRAMLRDRKHVLRFIMLLLAEGGSELSEVISRIRDDDGDEKRSGRGGPAGDFEFPVFEKLVRALDRNPARLDRVAAVIDDLLKTPEGRDLLPEGFEEVWGPIWAARQGVRT